MKKAVPKPEMGGGGRGGGGFGARGGGRGDFAAPRGRGTRGAGRGRFGGTVIYQQFPHELSVLLN